MPHPFRRILPLAAAPRFSAATLAAILAVILAASPPLAALPGALVSEIDPLEPASSGGLRALDRALVRLSSHRRLMVVAAHPDDEDTALLTWVARGLGGEAAYLSLSRGDGGQNLIGPELGVGLGLLRSRELESARRIDGARQFFTRAFDFGYTRSLEETFERWPEEVLLADAVRVVRRFKPQVLMAVFPPTERAGHGQHQASAVVAERVLELAADPAAFPQLLAEGLPPWRVEAFFRAPWWDPDAATVTTELGRIEPFSGRSILQLALASRSQHRCQDMGFLQPLGDASGRLIRVHGGAEGEDGVFAGIATDLGALAELAPQRARDGVRRRLERIATTAAAARTRLTATGFSGAVEPLAEIVGLLREVGAEVEGAGAGEAGQHLADLVEEKLAIAQEALANAARVLADAVTDRPAVVPGERLAVRSIFWNAGEHATGDLEVAVSGSAGLRLVASAPAEPENAVFFPAQVSDTRHLELEVPDDAEPTLPYFLRRPLRGSLYDWTGVAPAVRGEPFGPPPLVVGYRFTLAGVPVELEREVVYRVRDQALGEVRRPLRVVPALELAVEPGLVVWPTADASPRTLRVTASTNLERATPARLEVEVPPGWPEVAPRPLELPPAPGRVVAEVELAPPAALAPGRYEVALALVGEDGARFDRALQVIDYEHVRPTPMPVPARVEVSAADVRLGELGRVGYVRGASDRVPEMLAAIGVPIELLTGDELLTGELGGYDAIVVGSRAYETSSELAAANPRLLDYVRGGGLLIVQYQQYAFVRGAFAPYPLDIDRPHGRVTDEEAPVRLLEPEHPVFHRPNRLAAADWEGWVQERGLYFGGTWDDAYRPLLAMADPGGEEHRGALLVAPVGEGWYVYTGLAFFRQLPAGVAGAYRLFANLLALGEGE